MIVTLRWEKREPSLIQWKSIPKMAEGELMKKGLIHGPEAYSHKAKKRPKISNL
jgi:hypothetical protein